MSDDGDDWQRRVSEETSRNEKWLAELSKFIAKVVGPLDGGVCPACRRPWEENTR